MKTRFFTAFGIATLALLIGFSACVDPREGYTPSQPIEFSHKLHAGNNEIPCEYCHTSVGESPHASVPTVDTCMNCHNQVEGNTDSGKQEIQKVRDAWREGESIEWVKVHDMPDHVQFSHEPHINEGVDCTECHGQVNTMDTVSVQNEFNMGWCVDCHREPENNAPVDCVTCHY
ncbi:MAG: cytochrome c3 family protein [Persicimonas sp.]